jgi:opacity protein-like surface antigen
MQFNAGVQRQLRWNSVIDVNFIYSRTLHEFMLDADVSNFFPGNGAPRILGDGTLPTNAISLVTADGYSRYRALTVKWDKRFAKRFQYTASYALSRLNTTNSDGLGQGGGVQFTEMLLPTTAQVELDLHATAHDEWHRRTSRRISHIVAVDSLHWPSASNHRWFRRYKR